MADTRELLAALVSASDKCDELRDARAWDSLAEAEEDEQQAWRNARAYLAAPVPAPPAEPTDKQRSIAFNYAEGFAGTSTVTAQEVLDAYLAIRDAAPAAEPVAQRRPRELLAEIELARQEGYRSGLSEGWKQGRANALEEAQIERNANAAAGEPAAQQPRDGYERSDC